MANKTGINKAPVCKKCLHNTADHRSMQKDYARWRGECQWVNCPCDGYEADE